MTISLKHISLWHTAHCEDTILQLLFVPSVCAVRASSVALSYRLAEITKFAKFHIKHCILLSSFGDV
jgi:hypothetical protein